MTAAASPAKRSSEKPCGRRVRQRCLGRLPPADPDAILRERAEDDGAGRPASPRLPDVGGWIQPVDQSLPLRVVYRQFPCILQCRLAQQP